MPFDFLNNTYLKTEKPDPKDRIDVEIGDSKQPDFYPQVKVSRWNNEVNFSARLVHNEKSPIVVQDGEKIKWQGEKIEAHFYDIEPNPNLLEGGVELEIILKEKPKANVIEFTVNTKGLVFDYQKPLNQDQLPELAVSASETEAFDAEGRVVGTRPANVVGSYAVFCSEEKTNWVGGKIYRQGKVGHIYRPKIEDALGNWVWGDLNIDEAKGILTVTIPQKFLDEAVYPIRHAAGLTFGYTTQGGTTAEHAGGTVRIFVDNSPEATGTANSIKFNVGSAVTSSTFRGVVYKSSYERVAYGANTSCLINAFATCNLAGEIVTSGVNYGPGVWLSGTQNMSYDASTKTLKRMTLAWHLTNPPSDPFVYASQIINVRYAIYCDYTASGLNFTQNLGDTLTLSESLDIKALGLSKGDTITLSDQASTVATFLRALTDMVTLSDAIVKVIIKSNDDTITLNDALVKNGILNKIDTITISDSVVKALTIARIDTITLNDQIGKALTSAQRVFGYSFN